MQFSAAILGTSNGIIHDGYPSAIKQSCLFRGITNYSVGASPCSFLPYRLSACDFSSADVIFVESLVNDAGAMRAGAFDGQDIFPCYEALFEVCARRGVRIVGILLPGLVRDQSFEEAYGILKSALETRQIEYWDGVKHIDEYAAAKGLQLKDVYRDPAHLKSEIIAGLFSCYLQELRLDRIKPPAPAAAGDGDHLEFVDITPDASSTLMVALPARARSKEISTSLLKASGMVLEHPFKLELLGDADFELHALVLNSNNTNCIVHCTGESSGLKSLTFRLVEGNDKVIITPFIGKPKSEHRRLLIESVATVADGQRCEKSYQASEALAEVPRMEILGFVVRKAQKKPRRTVDCRLKQ